MANVITSIRIICSIALLFCPVASVPFYVLYLTAGFTDMIDGTIARKTGTVSEFGSKLDTVADFILVSPRYKPPSRAGGLGQAEAMPKALEKTSYDNIVKGFVDQY